MISERADLDASSEQESRSKSSKIIVLHDHQNRARSKSIALPDYTKIKVGPGSIQRLNRYDATLRQKRNSIVSMQSSLPCIDEEEDADSNKV